MPADQTIVSGIILTLAVIMIFLAGRKENQGQTASFLTFSIFGVLFFYLFLNSITGLERGKYDTSLPETDVIHRTTSCIQGSYYAYFTAIKAKELEPHYFRKQGRCPPLQFRINKEGEYNPVYIAKSQKYNFRTPSPEPIIPKIKN